MADFKLTAEVAEANEESDDEFLARCEDDARTQIATLFKVSLEQPLMVYFNCGQDRIAFHDYLLSSYAYAAIKEGDPQLKDWKEAGWQPIGPRVSWRMTPTALEFSLSSGHKFEILRTALRDWYDGKGFPTLQKVA